MADRDWIETVVKVAESIGMNGVQVRWKLMRWAQSFKNTEGAVERKAQVLRYQHAICPNCGRVQDRSATKCTGCGESMASRPLQMLQRIGLVSPAFLSVSSLLGAVLVALHARTTLSHGLMAFISGDTEALLRYGAYWEPAIHRGQWWRFATPIFLHIGLLHLAFNVFALAQVGPMVEEVFGKARMLFIFLFTGILGFVACYYWKLGAPSAGASGALMGLVGAAAGWGQRDGTGFGHRTRNHMIQWGIYTMIFGVMVSANNVAHAGGFISGAILGYLTPPAWTRRHTLRPLDALLGAVALVGTVVAVFLVARPPASSHALVDKAQSANVQSSPMSIDDLRSACTLHKQGKRKEALEKLREAYHMEKARDQEVEKELDGLCRSMEHLEGICQRILSRGSKEPTKRLPGDLFGMDDDGDEASMKEYCEKHMGMESSPSAPRPPPPPPPH